MSKLANMRKGKPEHKIVDFPGTTEKVAIMALNNKQIIEAREDAMKYIADHPVDIDTGDLVLNMLVLLRAMRDPKDLKKPFAGSFEEIQEHMNPREVYELHNVLMEVQNGKIPELEDLTLEQFEDIKKKLETTELKELDGELQTILKLFHLRMNLNSSQTVN